MAKDYKGLAAEVIRNVGGKENIATVTHCITRLRFVLHSDDAADDAKVKEIEGVKGVAKAGGQYQVIIGTDVKNAYAEVADILGISKDPAKETKEKIDAAAPGKKDNPFNRFAKMISGIIMPFIPALTGVGLIKALLTILTMTGALTAESGTYQLLYAGADAFFYFLPIMCAFSAGKKFGGSPYVCAALAAALVYPNIVTAFNEGTQLTFLGIPVTLMNYSSGIFPAIVGSWLICRIEHFTKKFIPDIVQMFRPMLSLLIAVPITFLAIGPVFTMISSGLAAGCQALFTFSPILCGLLIGGFWQLIIIFGLHYAFIPILINNITTMGNDPVNAIMGVTVFAVSGAALGYALKMKNKTQKAEGMSTCVTGVLGITEPIIFGILLPYKKPFAAAILAGAIGGAVNALMGGTLFGFVGGGITSIIFSINPDGTMGTVIAFIVSRLLAFVLGTVFCYLMMKGDEKVEA